MTKKILSSIKIIAAFLLWIFAFRDFFFHANRINLETIASYSWTKFFMNNILNGVFPMWNPYLYLGTSPVPGYVMLGFLNPLVYLVGLLVKLGASYYDAYLIYLALLYFLGCLGFYFLSKVIFKDDDLAFLSYLLFLFSGAGAIIFATTNMLLMFIPGVWFLYFLVRFFEGFKTGDLMGATYSTMVMMTSYLPFHFATVFLLFATLWGCLYPRQLGYIVLGSWRYIKTKPGVVLGCLMAVGVSVIPLLLQKYESSSNEIVYPSRHCTETNLEDCFQGTLNNQSAMLYEETSRSGTLSERADFRALFSHLDKLSFGTDGILFIPVFGYLLIWLGLLTRFDRRVVLFIFLSTLIMLISLGGAAPVHRFLFEHIFFLKYFRNLFFFIVFLTPTLILLAVSQLKLIGQMPVVTLRRRLASIILVLILHLGFMIFLMKEGSIILTSFVTVIASSLFFALFFSGRLKLARPVSQWILAVIIIIQPLQVFSAFGQNASYFKCALPREHVAPPKFVFTRPAKNIPRECSANLFLPYIDYFWSYIILEDAAGEIGFPGAVGRGVFFLSHYINRSVWNEYVIDKLKLYDQVEPYEEKYEVLLNLENAMKDNVNKVFVSNVDEKLLKTFSSDHIGVEGTFTKALHTSDEEFKITHFDVNSLKFETHFKADKFLVYADSFHSGWKVFINGKSGRVYQANVAFKGIWLPPGPVNVVLKYEPLGGSGVYIFVTMFFAVFSVLTMWKLYYERELPV